MLAVVEVEQQATLLQPEVMAVVEPVVLELLQETLTQ